MTDDSNIKVLDCYAGDNEYLHRDFHGALCYTIKYLDDKFGHDATAEYLRQVGRTYFAPLSEKLKTDGLAALEDHWRNIFGTEGGKWSLDYDGDTLVLTVDECPAVAHIKATGHLYTDRFCVSTVIVNETICVDAGYKCSCQYEPGVGKCVQKFWKETE